MHEEQERVGGQVGAVGQLRPVPISALYSLKQLPNSFHQSEHWPAPGAGWLTLKVTLGQARAPPL